MFEIKTQRQFFNETNENILDITFDTQGTYWNGADRNKSLRNRLLYHQGYRCVGPITHAEKVIRAKYHKNKITDIFFQYKQFIPNLPVQYTHFQVRKNFYLLDNEIIYSKPFGIESYNLLNKKQQTLCVLSSEDERDSNKQMICFDVIRKPNGDYLICSGRCDGSVSLYNVSQSEMERVKEYKSNVVPKFENYLSKVISQGNSDEILTNYVKFINHDNNFLLLTTGNDGFIRIFDMNNDLKILQEYKSETAVNNCDFNSNRQILGCIGDSVNVELYDTRTSQLVNNFIAHNDFGIVLKFQPNSDNCFATGNQDYTCKLWDMRSLSSLKSKMETPTKFLTGYFESIGDLLFTKKSKEQFLIYAENADYLHIYNLKYDTIQTMSYLGSFCGLAYEENTSNILIGYQDQKPGILVYDTIKPYTNSSIDSYYI